MFCSLLRTNIYKHWWQNNLFDHLDTVHYESEKLLLLHRNNKCFFEAELCLKYCIPLKHLWNRKYNVLYSLTTLNYNSDTIKMINGLLSRPKIYKQKRLAIWISVENKKYTIINDKLIYSIIWLQFIITQKQ